LNLKDIDGEQACGTHDAKTDNKDVKSTERRIGKWAGNIS
jgi:hypothetical protein